VLTGSLDKTVRLWEAATGKEVYRFEGHTGPVARVAISANGRFAASAGWDKTVRTWGLAGAPPRS
jgi:WD40 repeat protein